MQSEYVSGHSQGQWAGFRWLASTGGFPNVCASLDSHSPPQKRSRTSFWSNHGGNIVPGYRFSGSLVVRRHVARGFLSEGVQRRALLV